MSLQIQPYIAVVLIRHRRLPPHQCGHEGNNGGDATAPMGELILWLRQQVLQFSGLQNYQVREI